MYELSQSETILKKFWIFSERGLSTLLNANIEDVIIQEDIEKRRIPLREILEGAKKIVPTGGKW